MNFVGLILVLLFTSMNAEIPQIKVGILIPSGTKIDNEVGFESTGGAVPVAIKKAIELQIYDPKLYNISFAWYFDQCVEQKSAGYAAQLVTRDKVDAILGPLCPPSARVVGAIADYNNVAFFPWGVMSPDFYSGRYKTAMPMSGTVRGTLVALSHVLVRYNWTEVGFIYNVVDSLDESIPICGYFSGLFASGTNYLAAETESYTRQVIETTIQSFREVLRSLRSRARIIVTCLESVSAKQNLMFAAVAEKMTTSEFVYLFIQTNAVGFGNSPFWMIENRVDESLKEAARNVLVLDKYTRGNEDTQSVKQEIAKGIREWPFYCTNCSGQANVSNLAVYLGDSMLTFLVALNQSHAQNGVTNLKNMTALVSNLRINSYQIPSIFGSTFPFIRGIRVARYSLVGLNVSNVPTVWATIHSILNVTYPVFNATYDDAATTIWATRNGLKPNSTPACGFLNERCVGSSWLSTIIGVGSALGFMIVIGGLFTAVYLFQHSQQKRLNSLWQINFIPLDNNPTPKSSERSNRRRSSASNGKVTDHTQFVYHDTELVVAVKRSYIGKWTSAEEEEFRKMRQLDHPNLNRFIGVAVVDRSAYFLWNFCERGSIIEVVEAHSDLTDAFIVTGMINDIVEGLHYIHHSSFLQHGNLSAYRCVVGDRFEVKIQMYGLSGVKERTIRRLDDRSALYVAPEHLRNTRNAVGSQAGDVYSFAITSVVILTSKPAYILELKDATNEEIAGKVARGDYPLTRPLLNVDQLMGVKPELIALIRRCWSERAEDRPNIDDIRNVFIERVLNHKSANIMDHLFSLMENRATDLEETVQERKLQLNEEKQKADFLLYSLMPKLAADQLKLGQLVEPEVYTSCTVFFSDIVSFTVLASKSTPLQVINFLNDVYTMSDEVIGAHDAYKVETIGDGLHVVSGVPKRNGNAHVKAIADMAIDFQRAIKNMRLSHLPDRPIQIRVGVHSGSCVAGIVGVSAPRFCVFGDTVNIAAKMEASSWAGRIHITSKTKSLIEQHYADEYSIVERGEALIKGFGTMNTFWLVPPENADGFEG